MTIYSLISIAKEALLLVKSKGFLFVLKKIYFFIFYPEARLFNQNLNEKYRFRNAGKRIDSSELLKISEACNQFIYNPLLSVIIPVYNTDLPWLKACINSVIEQVYSNWEICIYNDASTKKEIEPFLSELAVKNAQIKVLSGSKNLHISGASNAAIAIAQGEFVVLLDHDDLLCKSAFYHIVKELNVDQKLDYIYTNEDKIEADGSYSFPYFKPNFDRIILMEQNYLCHLSVIRKSVGDKIGWFREGFEGSQDYDFFLRLTEQTQNIKHIPRVLYHWRRTGQSTAQTQKNKQYITHTSLLALTDALRRNNIEGNIYQCPETGLFQLIPNSNFSFQYTHIFLIKDATSATIKRLTKMIKIISVLTPNIIFVGEEKLLVKLANITVNKLVIDNQNNFELVFAALADLKIEGNIYFQSTDVYFKNYDFLITMANRLLSKDINVVGCKIITDDNKLFYSGFERYSSNNLLFKYAGFHAETVGYFLDLVYSKSVTCMLPESIFFKSEFLESILQNNNLTTETINNKKYAILQNLYGGAILLQNLIVYSKKSLPQSKPDTDRLIDDLIKKYT
ncbi:MAG: glycosyltransferase [Bacteroidales bacterium]|nr:glycosyltransferase [Bacteroidales bacterium]